MAALMMISVVALSATLAGTAAAGVATADRSVSDSTPSPGSEVTVTTTVEMDSDGGPLSVTDSFSPEVESASIQSIEINGQDASLSQIAASGADSGAATVTLQNLPGDATVEITYTITTADQASQLYEITGTATSDNTEINVGSTTIETTAVGDSDFQVLGLSGPSRVDSGELFTASVFVKNEGNVEDTQTVRFQIDGSTVATQQLTLDTGERQRVDFTGLSVDTAGSYIYAGSTDDSSQTATLTVEESTDGNGVVSQYDTNDNGTIERSELGIAAADFANGDLSRADLGLIAANFASN